MSFEVLLGIASFLVMDHNFQNILNTKITSNNYRFWDNTYILPHRM